jgi:hypothetical protein
MAKDKMASKRGKLNQGNDGERSVQMPQVADANEGQDLVKWMMQCREEAKMAKQDRMDQNDENYRAYNLKHDFSHKNSGQSQEVLAKQRMAVEQISTFFQQAMADPAESFKAVSAPGIHDMDMRIKPREIGLITQRQLENANWFSTIGRVVKSGLLAALPILKVHGKFVCSPRYISKRNEKTGEKNVIKEDKEHWQLQHTLIRQENYYPDPTGNKLYEIEDMWMDFFELHALAEKGMYDIDAVNSLPNDFSEQDEDQRKKNIESSQNYTSHGHRRRVKVTEYWGTVLDIHTGKVIHKNIVFTVANDKWLIREPTMNPNWHQESPYVAEPLVDAPHGVWPIAMMDAPTKHQMAATEIYNLIVDGAMKAVHGINQIRPEWLIDPSQVENGIRWGETLKLNSMAPIGAKVLEDVSSGNVPNDAVNILNIINQEFNSAALTNDLRQGVIPFRQVKATEVVEASQTITSVFQGMTTNFETKFLVKVLEKTWKVIAQRMNDQYDPEMKALLGEARWKKISNISPQNRFTETVGQVRFEVFGISKRLAKQQDFRKWMMLLQTIGQSPQLMELFVQRYDLGKLLEEVISALDVDKKKIIRPEVEQRAEEMLEQEADGAGEAVVGQAPEGIDPSLLQVPQSGGGSVADLFGGGPEIPSADFPESRATPEGGF